MKIGVRIRKLVALLAFSSILLGVECPPLVVQSFKQGTVSWVSGSSALTDFVGSLLNIFSGGTNLST